jgi:hypothetical protein
MPQVIAAVALHPRSLAAYAALSVDSPSHPQGAQEASRWSMIGQSAFELSESDSPTAWPQVRISKVMPLGQNLINFLRLNRLLGESASLTSRSCFELAVSPSPPNASLDYELLNFSELAKMFLLVGSRGLWPFCRYRRTKTPRLQIGDCFSFGRCAPLRELLCCLTV